MHTLWSCRVYAEYLSERPTNRHYLVPFMPFVMLLRHNYPPIPHTPAHPEFRTPHNPPDALCLWTFLFCQKRSNAVAKSLPNGLGMDCWRLWWGLYWLGLAWLGRVGPGRVWIGLGSSLVWSGLVKQKAKDLQRAGSEMSSSHWQQLKQKQMHKYRQTHTHGTHNGNYKITKMWPSPKGLAACLFPLPLVLVFRLKQPELIWE